VDREIVVDAITKKEPDADHGVNTTCEERTRRSYMNKPGSEKQDVGHIGAAESMKYESTEHHLMFNRLFNILIKCFIFV